MDTQGDTGHHREGIDMQAHDQQDQHAPAPSGAGQDRPSAARLLLTVLASVAGAVLYVAGAGLLATQEWFLALGLEVEPWAHEVVSVSSSPSDWLATLGLAVLSALAIGALALTHWAGRLAFGTAVAAAVVPSSLMDLGGRRFSEEILEEPVWRVWLEFAGTSSAVQLTALLALALVVTGLVRGRRVGAAGRVRT